MATDFERATALPDREIIKRWLLLTAKQYDEAGNPLTPTKSMIDALMNNPDAINLYRTRLCDVSWFMRYINEWLARKANREDGCKGRFWEGRFKCQRLQDKGAILTCMSYVDLNPVRAKMAETPEKSHFTSVYKRIQSRQAQENLKAEKAIKTKFRQSSPVKMLQSHNLEQLEQAGFLSSIESIFEGLNLNDYLELLDYTGRQLREGKRGRIPPHLCGILQRLELDDKNWLESVQRYGSLFYYFAGKLETLVKAVTAVQRNWCWGKQGSELIYRKTAA